MNDKSKTEKTAFGVSEEHFKQILEEQERLSNETFEDEALKKFVKEPEELTPFDKFKIKLNFVSIFFLFLVIFLSSIIGGITNSMEAYVAFPIAILCLIGFVILIKDFKNKKKEF